MVIDVLKIGAMAASTRPRSQLLHGGEVAVDDNIEQPPQQEPDAVGGQVG
jgi:hypothetical protein